MTDKEKYEQALERARDVYTYYCDDTEQLRKLESIFPELKEPNDEQIRSHLINTFKEVYMTHDQLGNWHGVPVKNILAWLKKQKCIEPTDLRTWTYHV